MTVRTTSLLLPQVFVGPRTEVRTRLRKVLRKNIAATPAEVVRLIENQGLCEATQGLPVQFEVPVFAPRSSGNPGTCWLCELSDAVDTVRFASGDHGGMVEALAESAWGCLLLLEFGGFSFWDKYWDKLRSHLPSICRSGASFVNGYGIASTNPYLVSADLQRMCFRATGLRPSDYREGIPLDELLPDYSTLVAREQEETRS